MANRLLKQYRHCFIFATLSLIGCSDAHNKQPSIDTSNEPTATQISSEEFSKVDFTGTWKRHFLFNSTKEVTLKSKDAPAESGEVEILALESRTDSYFDVISVEQINETSTLIKYCDSLPAKLIEIDPENSIIIDSTSDSAITPSENNRISEYYRISDDHYRVDFYTNDKLDGYFELERSPSLSGFDFGMFSFSMSEKVDLNTSEDVCGIANLSTATLTDSLDDARFNPIPAHSNSYSINAPYEKSFVTLKLSFNSAIKEETYNVTQDTPSTELPVMVEISSPEFNASSDADTIIAINGREGLVRINAISDTSITGNYHITLENDAELKGDFYFDIK